MWHYPLTEEQAGNEPEWVSEWVGKMESKQEIKKARRERRGSRKRGGSMKDKSFLRAFEQSCVQSYRWLKSFRVSKIYSSCLNAWNIPSTPPFPDSVTTPPPPDVSLLHQLKTNFIYLSICHTFPLISSICPCIQITRITANTLHSEREKCKHTPPRRGLLVFIHCYCPEGC